jgi:ABC-type multidrug transport system fused ATPase/permease subunit
MIERMAEVLRATRETEGTAVLLVEQHLSFALSVADRFAVLKLGRIVEEGSHDALLAEGGIYADLWAHQSGGFLGT